MGRFIAPSCHMAGLDTAIFINNTARLGGAELSTSVKQEIMIVDLEIISEGRKIFSKKGFATVDFNCSLEIHEDYFREIIKEKEFSFVCRCYYENFTHFHPQEHQVVYHNKKSKKYATVLYDQFPDIDSLSSHIHPIILLAPKIWVSNQMTTYVVFTNINENKLQTDKSHPFNILILDEKGKVISSDHITIYNNTYILDIKNMLKSKVNLTEIPRFYNLIAKGGGDGSCVINTILFNEKTNNIAVEHSLYPAYYTTGNRDLIRAEALELHGIGEKLCK